MESKIDQFSKWEKIREKGFLRFVLLRGVLGWGLCTAVLYSLIMWLISDVDIRWLLPLALFLFLIAGVLWGGFMWWFIERKNKQNRNIG